MHAHLHLFATEQLVPKSVSCSMQDNQFNLDNTVLEGTSSWVQDWVKLITAVSADGGTVCQRLSGSHHCCLIP